MMTADVGKKLEGGQEGSIINVMKKQKRCITNPRVR
jgi:hypothetical protein